MHSAGINGLHQHTALVLAAKRFNEREEVARLSIGVDIQLGAYQTQYLVFE